ncbi:hypothetical protein Cni_G18089 [Canna indica]|uniref:Auxin response factor n=1 Tax=Canna indica TaxID=4628 RepID=A0AAQ3QE27_9LILI|nr:hypothetical protein Cni_G18089 [Canna indica]
MRIDLNAVEEEEAAPEAGSGGATVSLELWHACAGPRIWLPKKGSLVVYFPQGHLKHLGGAAVAGGGLAPDDMPPHVLCRVADVKLQAAEDTDDVYAQLSLVAENKELEPEQQGNEAGENEQVEETDDISRSQTTRMFCKTLTASDTSNHGGFSVPRRAAEDCFPPLDYEQQRPSQELVAKDLLGTEWRFRHIYRGQPRRHLLTTGWSAFINKKKLVTGDAVLFLRGNNGKLMLGVRRADQPKRTIHPPIGSQKDLGTFCDVANAVSKRLAFCINYNPRENGSVFIVPYWKFKRSLGHSFSIGKRFKMMNNSEDGADRRSTGLIIRTGELDSLSWPGSKWKCLLVRWDDEEDITGDNRVSPWDIELTSSPNALPTSGLKRAKICHPPDHLDHPIPNGVGYSDLLESRRFLEVLQGQENMGLKTLRHEGVHVNKTGIRNIAGIPPGNSGFLQKAFGVSSQPHKVLQGQEILPLLPTFQETPAETWSDNGARLFRQLLGTGGLWARTVHEFDGLGNPYSFSAPASSPSSVLPFQQEGTRLPCPPTMYVMGKPDEGDKVSSASLLGTKQMPFLVDCRSADDVSKQSGGNNCRHFGLPQTKKITSSNREEEGIGIGRSTAREAHYDESISLFKSQIVKTYGDFASLAGSAADHLRLSPCNDLVLQLGAV